MLFLVRAEEHDSEFSFEITFTTSGRGTGRASSRYKRMQINSDAASFVFPVMMDHAGLLCVGILLAQPRIPVAGTYLPPRRVFESLGLCIFFSSLVRRPFCFHGLSISVFFPPSFITLSFLMASLYLLFLPRSCPLSDLMASPSLPPPPTFFPFSFPRPPLQCPSLASGAVGCAPLGPRFGSHERLQE